MRFDRDGRGKVLFGLGVQSRRRGLSARAYRALTANRGVHFPCLFQPAVAMPPRFQQTGTRKKYAAVSVLSAVVTRPGRNSPYPLIITARMNGTEGACS